MKFLYSSVKKYVPDGRMLSIRDKDTVTFIRQQDVSKNPGVDEIVLNVPLSELSEVLPIRTLRVAMRCHGIVPSNGDAKEVMLQCSTHECTEFCRTHVSLFSRPPSTHLTMSLEDASKRDASVPVEKIPPIEDDVTRPPFPPIPLSMERCAELVKEWRDAISADALMYETCGVCARRTQASTMTMVNTLDPRLRVLVRDGISFTRQERKLYSDPICSIDGPVLCPEGVHSSVNKSGVHICAECMVALDANRMPILSLANGQWLGHVPPELKRLNPTERMMVSLYRHNAFVVRVRKGQKKMISNAIVFSQPIAKLCKVLPPTFEEMEGCMGVVFVGPNKPTIEDYKRTRFLVRKSYVRAALNWLVLNHKDYKDVIIDASRLDKYDENVPPGFIKYQPGSATETGENIASHENVEERGTETGPCPLTVQGISVDTLTGLTPKARIASVIRNHLREGKPVLAVGRSDVPESIYHNPEQFPGMFPWLFPYGLGGFDTDRITKRLDRKPHVQRLLEYHDRSLLRLTFIFLSSC
ncbi:hypothetical protein NLI96_g7136 [Meripilus lineatus]|uniref:DUF6570 domain-containing protein n=1 Tax=Meripilus lineatus TaxID=2056292 RepID=A0AAD5V202_9APHY|nr:hypothetical protein NLI96_g7136 [Physisporinus lineatus]